MKMNEIKLKPCPFCGKKVKKITAPLRGTQMFVCSGCGADVCFYGAEYEPKATQAWNRGLKMRLIDADELEAILRCLADKYERKRPRIALMLWTTLNILKCAEIVEAEPVRHSKWISLNNSSHKFCESCGVEFNIHFYEKNDYRFCPYCGAKMDIRL